ncbi:hypothetical protein NPIL_584081 [Nephila pilipes]|uniref:Uncharacterized protein n=1 Tax=Nephila pilipes TaxID=299642 RepID=A0A8X6MMW5_NEPPI|nr:hypothetical protein NPIL_584081 [Nephila pilipes]
MNRQLAYRQKLKQDLQRKFRSRSRGFPAVLIQPEEAAKACFSDKTKDSGHGEGIPYAHLSNAPGDPDQRSTILNDPGPGRKVSVDPSTVYGRVLKIKYGKNCETGF